MRVDRPGHDFLADAGLAAHQHGDVGAGGLLDHLQDVTHRRTHEQRELALQPLAVVVDDRRRRLAARATGHGADGVLEILGRVRPPDEVVGAGLDRLDDLRAVAGVGHHDHRPGLGQHRHGRSEGMERLRNHQSMRIRSDDHEVPWHFPEVEDCLLGEMGHGLKPRNGGQR